MPTKEKKPAANITPAIAVGRSQSAVACGSVNPQAPSVPSTSGAFPPRMSTSHPRRIGKQVSSPAASVEPRTVTTAGSLYRPR